jgi:hypothetical protein
MPSLFDHFKAQLGREAGICPAEAAGTGVDGEGVQARAIDAGLPGFDCPRAR